MSVPSVAPDPAEELERNRVLRTYAILNTPRDLVFDRVVFTAAQLFRVPMAAISLVDENREWFKAQVGISAKEYPRSIAFCAHTILSDDVLVITDTTQDPRFASNPLVTRKPHIRFYAGAPLITAAGLRLGSLCVMDYQPRLATPQQTWQLRQLAESAMDALEARRDRMQKKMPALPQLPAILAASGGGTGQAML